MKKLVEFYLVVFRFWMKFPEKIRYLLVGGYNTVISLGLYELFLWLWNRHQLALFLSFFVSSINSYWTQKIYVFNTRGKVAKEYFRCLFSWGVSYGLNVILLEVFVRLGMNPRVAQIPALALVTINSYLMLKYIAFQNHKKGEKNEGCRFDSLL